jgi:hypothetical protein
MTFSSRVLYAAPTNNDGYIRRVVSLFTVLHRCPYIVLYCIVLAWFLVTIIRPFNRLRVRIIFYSTYYIICSISVYRLSVWENLVVVDVISGLHAFRRLYGIIYRLACISWCINLSNWGHILRQRCWMVSIMKKHTWPVVNTKTVDAVVHRHQSWLTQT